MRRRWRSAGRGRRERRRGSCDRLVDERRGCQLAERLADRATRRWRSEFPYHWDADDLVSRRQLLRFTVFTSGALFVSTTILAALGLIQRPEAVQQKAVAKASDVPEGSGRLLHLSQSRRPGDAAASARRRVRRLQPEMHPPLLRRLLPARAGPPLLPVPRRRVQPPRPATRGWPASPPAAPDRPPARWRHDLRRGTGSHERQAANLAEPRSGSRSTTRGPTILPRQARGR